MKLTRLATLSILLLPLAAYSDHHEMDSSAVDNSHRTEANRERDGERKPGQVLAFIGLEDGATVLDWGAGGGYWTELFAAEVGADGRVYAQQRAGERFDSNKDAYMAQFEPFGNVELLPMAGDDPIPLEDNSVDAVMLSYVFHHMHYSEASGESLPDSTAAILGEFRRVLKPGGSLIVIEHQAAAGSSRAESAAWHRTPAETAKADITAAGFEFAGEAPDIYNNPDDDQMNMWGQVGLRGKTTGFVHKYVAAD